MTRTFFMLFMAGALASCTGCETGGQLFGCHSSSSCTAPCSAGACNANAGAVAASPAGNGAIPASYNSAMPGDPAGGDPSACGMNGCGPGGYGQAGCGPSCGPNGCGPNGCGDPNGGYGYGNGPLPRGVGGQFVGPQGPPTGGVAYPYYTNRGPRDYFDPNPPSIGP